MFSWGNGLSCVARVLQVRLGSVLEMYGFGLPRGTQPTGQITVLWHPSASGLVALGFAGVGISYWCLVDSVGSVCWLVLVDLL